jgi:predicted nuclease of predicted toxin-antitoxin system
VAAVTLDENVPDSVGTILRKAGHDVALARDQQLAVADDDRLLSVASAEGRALITLDRDFTNTLRHHPGTRAGIIVIRLHAQTLLLIRRSADELARLLAEESPRGHLWILDESKLRIWPRDIGPA